MRADLLSLGTLVFLGLAGLLSPAAPDALAQDFRIENRVFEADKEEPITQTTTLFRAGTVYDFLQGPGGEDDKETTIFDPRRSRFIVVDPQRRLWTEVSLAEIQDFSAKLRAEAAGHAEPLLNFLAAPQFKEETDDQERLVLTSYYMEYRLKTMPAKSPEVARFYSGFARWHALLKPMVNPRSLPSFGRIWVNELLEKRGLLPVGVEMTLLPNDRRRTTLRAEHEFEWTLLERDREQIDEVHRQLAEFRRVTLEDYNDHSPAAAQRPQPPTASRQ